MDKGKNRSDLLAAGRKKLLQYRQKKDGKGGGGDQQGKPSQKAGGKASKEAATFPEVNRERDPDAEADKLAESVPESAGDAAADDVGELPFAAILARNLADGDSGLAVDDGLGSVDSSRLCSNGDVVLDGVLGESMPGAGLDIHGGMQECAERSSFSEESALGSAPILQSDGLKVVVECATSRVNGSGREGPDDHAINRGPEGTPEVNVSFGPSPQTEVMCDTVISYSPHPETYSVLVSTPHVDAGAERSAEVQDLGSSLAKPQANPDGGDTCPTSIGIDIIAAETGGGGRIATVKEKMAVMIAQYGEDGYVNSFPMQKDLSSTCSEETEIPHKRVFDDQSLHQSSDDSGSLSQNRKMLALGIVEGDTGKIYKTQGQILFDGDLEKDSGEEAAESNFLSHLEDGQKSPGDEKSSAPNVDFLDLPGTMSLPANISEEADKLKQHLYLITVENDLMYRQFEIQVADGRSSEEPSKQSISTPVTDDNNASIYQELVYCRSALYAITTKKEESEVLFERAKEEIELLNARISELQNQMETSHQESAAVSTENVNLLVKVSAAEKEISSLHEHLVMETEEKKKLEGEKEYFVSENMKLARELSERKEQLLLALDQQMQLERDLKESLTPLEKLSEENLSLSICLDFYRCKLRDLDGMLILLPQPDGLQNLAGEDHQQSFGSYHMDAPLVNHESGANLQQEKCRRTLEFCDKDAKDCGPFFIWKRHKEDASDMVMKLEKTLHGMHSPSLLSNMVGGREATSSVSKPSLSFEPNGQPDNGSTHEISLISSVENESSKDIISFAQEQTKYLRKLLEEMDSNMEHAFLLFKHQEEHMIHAEEFMSEYKAQKLQNENLHAKILELVQLLLNCKSVVDVLQNQMEDMSRSLGSEFENFVGQLEVLQSEVFSCLSSLERDQGLTKDVVMQMVKKLDASAGYFASGDGNFTHLANESVDAAAKSIESLKERLEAVQSDNDAKSCSFNELHGDFLNLHKFSDFSVGVLVQILNCLRELTNDSYEKLDVKDVPMLNYEWLEAIRHDSVAIVQELKQMLHERVQIIGAKEEFEAENIKKSKTLLELEERCSSLQKDLAVVNIEKNETRESLLCIFNNLQKLSCRCSVLARKFVDCEMDILADDSSFNDVLSANDVMLESLDAQVSHIEDSVVLFLEKFEEMGKEITLAKNYLGEVESLANVYGDVFSMPLHIFLKEKCIPKLMEMGQLQEKFLSLNAELLEKRNEIEILSASLNKLEEAFRVKSSEFDLKVAELEQSEQKLSSVREKLSIAVAKGKGLVTQRDSLKQSLVEKSNELEKCLQELRTKEMMLHETEAKLKSYPEVDRVEALESELSYIRNSATAFRDSFLLKDSMLQRIEEVLDDLDLPEHFYLKDTVEKIQLLAKSVVDSSSLKVTDWEPRSPVEEPHLDEHSGASDASKEDQSLTSVSEADDLKKRFDELQRKFYGLAEHNDMLEQSLVERHSIIQRWEELLDMIDMPIYLRSMEPVVRLEWLGKALPEVQREHNSLLAKVESLAESNESLMTNLQELQGQVSELEAALISAEMERVSLSTLLNVLRLENSKLLDQRSQNVELLSRNLELETRLVSVEKERGSLSAEVDELRLELSNMETQNEVERVQLQKDNSDLQEQLLKSISNSVDNRILKSVRDIQILIDSLVGESGSVHQGSCDDLIDNLEKSSQKLVDDYKALVAEKSMVEHNLNLAVDAQKLLEEQKMELLSDKEKHIMMLKTQLEEASHSLITVKEGLYTKDKDVLMLKSQLEEESHSLTLLKEELYDKEKDIRMLQTQLEEASHGLIMVKEELYATTEKHRLLLMDVQEMVSQKNILLADKESMINKYQVLQMELTALKAQLDEASHAMVLVEEEKNTLLEDKGTLQSELEVLIKQRNSLLLDREATLEKCQGLLSEVELLSKQRDAVMEQLNQEEQKSASVREKLNVAVRKGKALVQQRDGLKQAIEEMSTKVEQLENRLNQSSSENLSLRNKLVETESILQNNKQSLNGILTALHAIDIDKAPFSNPIEMLEGIQILLNDRLALALSKEQEAKKSRKASELLVAELNEVQERADGLQEELSKIETALVECCTERDEAKTARGDAIDKLEQVLIAHSEEREKDACDIILIGSRIDKITNGWLDVLNLTSDILSKDFDFVNSLETGAEFIMRQVNGTMKSDCTIVPSYRSSSKGVVNKDKSFTASVKGQSISEYLHFANRSLSCCMEELDNFKEMLHEHYAAIEQKAKFATMLMESIQKEISFLSTSDEPLSTMLNCLEMSKKNKETEISMLQRCLVLLFEACKSSILEIESKQSGKKGSVFESETVKSIMNLPMFVKEQERDAESHIPFTEDHIKMLVETLSSAVRNFQNMLEETAEDKHQGLKSLVSDLQQQLLEKDIQTNRICAELVSQIKDAESLAKKKSMDLESALREMHNLENHLKVVEDDKKLLEKKVDGLNDVELASKDLLARITSLSESLTGKDQEIEALMQALDVEESQMEIMQARNQELEKLLEEKAVAFESLEASRSKAMMKLSTTVNKFDELHQLSENLLVEVENLQSQLQERDSEISFLRQEVTRCTKDVIAEQESNKKVLSDMSELQHWIARMFTRFGLPDANFENQSGGQLDIYKEFLDEKLLYVVTELHNLRGSSQNKDALLQIEKDRVHELLRKTEVLESTLQERESQIELYKRTRDSGQLSTADSPEPLEIESVRNIVATSSSVVPLIRSGRKITSDHVSLDMDLEQGGAPEDEDDDKAHGFRSLTMSKVVPRFTRPVAERIDGLWVSVERLLMRQPSLRLGLIIYWIVLHAMLASSI